MNWEGGMVGGVGWKRIAKVGGVGWARVRELRLVGWWEKSGKVGG
jgi:hypothetical protein